MRGAVLVRESEKDGQIDSKKEAKGFFYRDEESPKPLRNYSSIACTNECWSNL